MAKWYPAHNYTPADANSLQAIPNPGAYTDLNSGDMALVYNSSGQLDVLVYNSTSDLTEDIPLVVTPDGNAGPGGRWLKQEFNPWVNPTEYTSAGAISPTITFAELNAAGGAMAMTYAAPVKGMTVVLTCTDATGDVTVTLSSGSFFFINGGIDSSGTVATFNTAGQTLVLFAISASAFIVLQNIGQVGIE